MTAGHETRDADLRAVVVVTAAIFALVLVVFAGMRLLLDGLAAREAWRSPAASPLAERHARRVPPEPRLQPDPLRDLAALRAEEDALLGTYEWVDRQAGRVRIPIGRAMELLAARGTRRERR
jgi:hypothetical protein